MASREAFTTIVPVASGLFTRSETARPRWRSCWKVSKNSIVLCVLCCTWLSTSRSVFFPRSFSLRLPVFPFTHNFSLVLAEGELKARSEAAEGSINEAVREITQLETERAHLRQNSDQLGREIKNRSKQLEATSQGLQSQRQGKFSCLCLNCSS